MSRILLSRLSLSSLFICNACSKKFHSQLPQSLRNRVCNVFSNVRSRNFSTSVRKFSEVKGLTKKVPIKLRKSELDRLFSLAKPEKWKLVTAICLLVVSSGVTMAVPFCLGKVIDIIYTKDSVKMRENLNNLSLILCGVFLLGSVCNFGRVYFMSVSGHRITKALREKVFRSIVTQEVAFFDRNKTGELINRLSADSALVSQSVTVNISDGLRSGISIVAGVSMMFYMSWELALVGLAIVPPVAGCAIIYGRFVRNITKTVQDSLASATQVANERIANIRTVKAFSAEGREYERYADKMQTVLNLAYKESLARAAFYGMTGLAGNTMILSVLYYGSVMVSHDTISVGNLSAFLLYAAYIGVSIGGLTSFYAEMNRGLGASTRLWEIVDRTPAIPVEGGLVPLTEPVGHMTFKGVTFSYPSRPVQPVLRDLDLDIPPSSVTAVVGSSGSGKSTLAALMLRLYDPDHGVVTLDGRPVTELDPRWLRKYISAVSQEPVLFSGSIRDNILYGAPDPESVTEERLFAVAKESNCYDFITQQLNDGFDTLVGERGVMLSGGQKQRIAIARALIKNPRILLLDEATSALDAESEHLVQDALQRVMTGRTVLTIAHRLSTVLNADKIVVLERGQLVETGTYAQLMAKNGAFKKLVKHQTFQGGASE